EIQGAGLSDRGRGESRGRRGQPARLCRRRTRRLHRQARGEGEEVRRERARKFPFLSPAASVLVAPSMRPVAFLLLSLSLGLSVIRAAEDPLQDAPPSYRDAMYAAMRSF